MDIAYAAGLFDGEGCVHIQRKKSATRSHYELFAAINMTDPRAVRQLHATFGGHFKSRRPTLRSTHRPLHGWTITTQKAADFLTAILPYLIVKKEEVEVALAYNARVDRRITGRYRWTVIPPEEIAFRDHCWSELRRLKHVIHP